MSNGARHGLGVLAGIVAIPALTALLIFGADRITRQRNHLAETYKDGSVVDGLVLLGVLAACGLLVALLCGSRLSPLASLIAGAPLLGYGAFWAVRPMHAMTQLGDVTKGHKYATELVFVSQSGLVAVIGAALVLASFPPSRWRSRKADASLPFSGAAGERPVAASWTPPGDVPMAPHQEAPPLFERPAAPDAAVPPVSGGGRHAAGGPEAKGGEWTQTYGPGTH
ncbi:hypothetical protein [Actinomadura harenae]|uniref:Uncharacterized protein n=1 Tax=Actinomadura harenae TaxID=2483351 RepID=A0A3M2MDP3_9ACTN|nr:hypothetical protein [Actinomadura harenae]RMI47003.1 hypothetical protein EBO15_05135 [Actinomadura harenae]